MHAMHNGEANLVDGHDPIIGAESHTVDLGPDPDAPNPVLLRDHSAQTHEFLGPDRYFMVGAAEHKELSVVIEGDTAGIEAQALLDAYLLALRVPQRDGFVPAADEQLCLGLRPRRVPLHAPDGRRPHQLALGVALGVPQQHCAVHEAQGQHCAVRIPRGTQALARNGELHHLVLVTRPDTEVVGAQTDQLVVHRVETQVLHRGRVLVFHHTFRL